MASSLRRTAHDLLSTLLVIAHLFIGWKALSYAANSPAPIAVVTSESMEPGFQRGDVLFLWNRQAAIEVGDIALVAFPTRKLPMVRMLIYQATRNLAPPGTNIHFQLSQVHRVIQSYYLPSPSDKNGASGVM